MNYAERLPSILVLVFLVVGGIQSVPVQVLLIDSKIRSSKCNPIVVSIGDARDCGFADSGHMQGRRIEVGDVAQTGLEVFSMRIVGHDRTAGCRFPGGNYPVVALCPGFGCRLVAGRSNVLTSCNRR